MPSPLVSVIIPSYNYGHYIGKTLDSVREQTFNNWECLIIDDGSTDDTREIVTPYLVIDPRIKLIRQVNQGLATARNTGIRKSRGRYIQFLDADDLLEDRKIECHVEVLETHPEVDIAYGSARYFKLENTSDLTFSMQEADQPWMPNVSGSGKELLLALVRQNIMVVSAALIRKQVIEDVGEFDICFSALEDWDYWLRCAVKGKWFQYLEAENTLSLIRWHPDSLSKDRHKMDSHLRRLRRKLNKSSLDSDVLTLNKKLASNFEGHKGIEEVQFGKLITGMHLLFRAGLSCPDLRDKVKWFYLVGIAPFSFRMSFSHLAYLPIRASLRKIVRFGY